eukprot:1141997-Pelagomonas_calceolata.AAC.15
MLFILKGLRGEGVAGRKAVESRRGSFQLGSLAGTPCIGWKNDSLHKKEAVSNPGYYRMITVSGVMYRNYANVLENVVTTSGWCVREKRVPDTQFGLYPGRITLHPLFI